MKPTVSHVLYPTDFSKHSKKALQFAAEIASKKDAELTIFHATQESMDIAADFEHQKQEAIKESEKKFDLLLEDLEKEEKFADLNVSTVLESGDPVSALFEIAGGDDIDLIVMGTQGATADRNELFGSVTTSVIKKTKIPVLAVPYGSTFDNFKDITFTTDYKEGDLKAFKKLSDIAEPFESKINVLHVADEHGFKEDILFRGFRDLLQEKASYKNLDFYLEYEFDFFSGVADYLIDTPTSLFTVIKYKKTFWEKLIERNHTKEMAFYSKVPILVLVGEQNPDTSTIIED